MYKIKNIWDEPFAIGGCPLLQKGDTTEVDAHVIEMVRNNPNIKILEEKLEGVEVETKNNKTNHTLKGIE